MILVFNDHTESANAWDEEFGGGSIPGGLTSHNTPGSPGVSGGLLSFTCGADPSTNVRGYSKALSSIVGGYANRIIETLCGMNGAAFNYASVGLGLVDESAGNNSYSIILGYDNGAGGPVYKLIQMNNDTSFNATLATAPRTVDPACLRIVIGANETVPVRFEYSEDGGATWTLLTSVTIADQANYSAYLNASAGGNNGDVHAYFDYLRVR